MAFQGILPAPIYFMTVLIHTAQARLPTQFGEFQLHVFKDHRTGSEHTALSCGNLSKNAPPLVRVHSECLTGDVFASTRCDCGEQLAMAQQQIQQAGTGLILYLRDHEGRGIGLHNKMRAYALQDTGLDTVEANLALGLPVDQRDYQAAADMLAFFGVRAIQLMTNNLAKRQALEALGVQVVAQQALLAPTTQENHHYLRTKAEKMGHLIPIDPPL